ncbi:MAG: hypothetical protein Q4F65_10315, partial [Propionibacteriaceae bacterium]|nr:hypothetical protein [Propionibacteriaceae bacterium]
LDAERAGLVLVCHEAAEPDRALTRTLTLAGVPHLVIRTEPERAVVGPFVIPGAGPCVGCTDLVRRDLDPAFPHLLAQLCRATHIPLPRQAAWAAGLACSQVAAWCAGQRLQSLGATLELDAHTGAVGTRLWPRHPDCPCALVHG